MKRMDAIRLISEALDDELVVSNIGFPSRELFAVRDRPENFYMTGSMGLASSIGLGLALNSHRKIWVIDGDGSVLMNLGTLVTIANRKPENLVLIVLDDSSYGSTGCQPTYTGGVTSLAEMARGAGIESVSNVDGNELGSLLFSLRGKPGPHVVVARIDPGNAAVPTIPQGSVEIKKRFMEAIDHR